MDRCKHGHDWAHNTKIDKRGYRYCRSCNAEKARARCRRSDAVAAIRSLSPAGRYCEHKMTTANTYVRPSGARECRRCKADAVMRGSRKRGVKLASVIPIEERLIGKMSVDGNGCWIWLAAKDSSGYGRIGTSSYKTESAHRVVYRLVRGEIPAGLDLDHLCRIRACCNPDHLEPVTRAENLRRGAGRGGVLS